MNSAKVLGIWTSKCQSCPGLNSQEAMLTGPAQLEIGAAKLFSWRALAVVHAYSLLLAAPVVSAALAMTLIGFDWASLLLPFAAFGVTILFLPLGFGNPHISRLVRRLRAETENGQDGWVVQLTLWPRIRTGLRAAIEDADDIGWLIINDSGVVFAGDSVKLSVPAIQIAEVQLVNVGMRGLFVYGHRIRVSVTGLREVTAMEFAERSSWWLPGSRRTTRRLFEGMRGRACRMTT